MKVSSTKRIIKSKLIQRFFLEPSCLNPQHEKYDLKLIQVPVCSRHFVLPRKSKNKRLFNPSPLEKYLLCQGKKLSCERCRPLNGVKRCFVNWHFRLPLRGIWFDEEGKIRLRMVLKLMQLVLLR